MGQSVDAGRCCHCWREIEREQRVVNNDFRCDLDVRYGNLAGRTVGSMLRETVGRCHLRPCIGRGNGDEGNEWLIRGKASARWSTAAPLFQRKTDSFRYTDGTSPAQADNCIDLVLVSEVRGFSYLEVGNMRLNMFVARYQVIA